MAEKTTPATQPPRKRSQGSPMLSKPLGRFSDSSDQRLDMQDNGGQHIGEADRLRDEFHVARIDFRARVEQCASADAVENVDNQLVQGFNAESLRSRAAIGALQDQALWLIASIALLRGRRPQIVPTALRRTNRRRPRRTSCAASSRRWSTTRGGSIRRMRRRATLPHKCKVVTRSAWCYDAESQAFSLIVRSLLKNVRPLFDAKMTSRTRLLAFARWEVPLHLRCAEVTR